MRVPESIEELRRICQWSFHAWNEQPWFFRQIRRISIYLTWCLLHLPLTANQITGLAITTGLSSCVLFSLNHALEASILLLFSVLLDFSDGEIGRYRRQLSREGAYLDKIYHFTVHPAIFAGVTIAEYRTHPATWIVVAGLICTISTSALSVARTYAAWITLWGRGRTLVAAARRALETETKGPPFEIAPHVTGANLVSPPPSDSPLLSRAKASRSGRLFSITATFWDFPYILLLVVAVAGVQSACVGTVGGSVMAWLLVFYALTYPVLVAVFVYYHVASRSVSAEYNGFQQDLAAIMAAAQGSKLHDHR